MRILGIDGSYKNGFTSKLLRKAMQSVPSQVQKSILKASETRKCISEMKKSDGVIFATPTHWFQCSIPLRNLLYKMSYLPYSTFEGKTVAVTATCKEDGGQQAINSLIVPLNHLGFWIMPWGMVFYNLSSKNHGEYGWQKRDVEHLGKYMVEYLTP